MSEKVYTSTKRQDQAKAKINYDRQLNKLSETDRKVAENISFYVDEYINNENAQMEDIEANKKQLKEFIKEHKLGITVSNLRDQLKGLEVNKPRLIQGRFFILNNQRMLMQVKDYIYLLENAVINKESNNNLSLELSFSDLIKITIKRFQRIFKLIRS